MNSSPAPFGPRVRNSLITIADLGPGEAVGVGFGVGDEVGVGRGVGVGVGVATVKSAAEDCMPRADAMISAVPAVSAFAKPFWSMVATETLLDRQLKIMSPLF